MRSDALLLGLALTVLPLSAPSAQTPPATAACDALAANPADRSRPPDVPGVAYDELDPARAIPACEAAVEQRPRDARYQYQLGRALIKARHNDEALAYFRAAAKQGFAPAENGLGLNYQYGLGVASSARQAVEWFRRAAAQQYAPAQANLGIAYYHGRGVPRNPREAA